MGKPSGDVDSISSWRSYKTALSGLEAAEVTKWKRNEINVMIPCMSVKNKNCLAWQKKLMKLK